MNVDAMYPGSFDPITNGHSDLIRRASRLYGRVVVAVASHTGKSTMFDVDERVDLARRVLSDIENVDVMGYEGLTVDFAREHNLAVVIRGLRAVSDFEFEFQLATMNRHLDEEIETVFLTPAESFTFISSSLVREIATLGGDVSEFVHPLVGKALAATQS